MPTTRSHHSFRTASSLSALLAAPILMLALPSAATAHGSHANVQVEIHGEDDHNLTVSVGGWAADLVRAALPSVVHCSGDRDENVVTVLRFLDHHGAGSRYTLWDDGREFTGVRTGNRFELRVGGRSGWRHGRAHIEAPWALARCMLGGTVAIKDLVDAGETGLDVLVAGDDGRVHIKIQ